MLKSLIACEQLELLKFYDANFIAHGQIQDSGQNRRSMASTSAAFALSKAPFDAYGDRRTHRIKPGQRQSCPDPSAQSRPAVEDRRITICGAAPARGVRLECRSWILHWRRFGR